MFWQKIAVVGVGLLGGSLGLAVKQRRLAGRVDGFVRREASLAECLACGVVDRATLDLAEAVAEADLVVLCTPLSQMRSLAERMRSALKPGAVVTDVGSVKSSVVRDLEPLFEGSAVRFVGSHPMAGAEKIGVRAARADLFDKAVCVITPTPRTAREAARQVDGFWQAVGSRTLELSPALHDELAARASHLPHVLAAHLADYILQPEHPPSQALLCASGFRDTTRVASGSPEMWRDIALANGEVLLRELDVLTGRLERFRRWVKAGDAQAIQEFFATAKARRDQWCLNHAPTSPE